MTFDKNTGEIDVERELEKQSTGRGGLDDEASHRRRTPGTKLFLMVIIALGVLLGGFLTWRAWQRAHRSPDSVSHKVAKVENTLPPFTPYLPAPSPDPVASAAPAAAVPAAASTPKASDGKPVKTPEELLEDRRLAGGFGAGTGPGDSSDAVKPVRATLAGGAGEGNPDNPLEKRLQPLKLKPSVAGRLSNRDFLLTRGAMIDCGQQSMLITDQPGMVTCYTTADVYSANGHVVVIDAGSKVVGSYQTGITQGQSRVFVMWQRIETPAGVIVDLDSPGTDALGGAGEPGQVDTHFWARFGGAIMLSLVGDFGQAVVNAAQHSGGQTLTLNNTSNSTSEMSTEALRNTINIPPTLYKNQGDRVSIFVARDLDFSDVYSLK
jgi:type IV secretion system protein VirB10